MARGGLILLAAQILAQVLSLAIVSLLTRSLGPEGYGLFSIVFAFVAPVLGFTAFASAIPFRYGGRYLSLNQPGKAKDIFLKCLVLMVLVAVGSSAVLWGLSFFLRSGIYLVVAIPYVVFSLLTPVFLSIFYSLTRFRYFALGTALPGLLLLPILWAFRDQGLFGVFISYDISAALAFALLALLAFWSFLGRTPREPASEGYRELFRSSSQYYVSTLLATLTTRVGVIVLATYAFLHGIEEVGYFNLAAFIVVAGYSAIFSFIEAVGPLLVKIHALNERERLQNALAEAFRFGLFVAVPLCLLLPSLGEFLVTFFFRKEFGTAATNLVLLGPLIPLTVVARLSRYVSVLQNKFGFLVLVELVGLATTAIVSLVLVPPLASAGASLALLAGSGAVAVLYVHKAANFGFSLPLQMIPRFVAAGAPLLLLLLVPRSLLLLPAAVGVGLAYLLILRIQGLFRWEDWRRLLGILHSE